MPSLLENFYQQSLIILPEFSSFITLLLALGLDKTLGEAKRFHYLVGFGWLANIVEQKLNTQHLVENSKKTPALKVKLYGAFAWCLLVLPLPILYYLFVDSLIGYWQIIIDAFVLYLAIGLNSLHQHAMQIYRPLQSDDFKTARHFTGYIVSRETNKLTKQEMSRATVESMLENGHDSVIASLIYFLIGGAPLVILHRFANTLDAMWGYKNSRYINFGFASARLDDVLGFFTGKCCTLLYAIQGLKQGTLSQALLNAYRQGNQYKSHNGGWVMAAGATVMNRKIGGSALYHGKVKHSVTLGCGKYIAVSDIPMSLTVVNRASFTLLVLACVSVII